MRDRIILLLGIGLTTYLLYSIFLSGYSYQLDNDEVFNVQLTYLIAHGFEPYRDIYMTVYTPLFQWFIAPVFGLFGFSFATIGFARYVMIILFFLRVGAGALLARELFGRRAGILFALLLLLDPFSIFSGMQIRQDNLMVALFTFGALALAMGLKRSSVKLIGVSGALLVGSFLVLLKILPSVGAVLGVVSIALLLRRKVKFLKALWLGVGVTVLLFFSYFLIAGTLPEMIRQVFIEAVASYSGVFEYPVPVGQFYLPGNSFIYGLGGKPLTWIYAWVLPLLGAMGIYRAIAAVKEKRSADLASSISFGLIGGLIGQWLLLFYFESVFIQHYLPVTWLFALFGAYAIDGMLSAVPTGHQLVRTLVQGGLVICFGALIVTSIKANMARSAFTGDSFVAYYEALWRAIPENEGVFPNIMFRPLVYPVPAGHFIGNIPQSILGRLPNITTMLTEQKVEHVVVSDYYLGHLPPDASAYLLGHYQKVAGIADLYKRID